jgi:tRNA (guanine37-N1)-methyltransferase
MRAEIITIFPEYLAPLDLSLIGRARSAGLLQLSVYDLRQWTHDVHRTVDDTPYGGGPGMVMRPEPWGEALDARIADGPRPHLVVPSPAGRRFTQAMAAAFAAEERLVFACGRYEGIDQRVLDHAATRVPVTEVSLGDYVLFGGEVAVLVVLEAVTRLLPGVLGNAGSLEDESHAAGLLEAPVYTKPPSWRGLPVPEVLRSGDHGRIARWRRDQALARTAERRPDLLAALPPDALSDRDRDALAGAGFPVLRPDVAK